MTTKQVYKVTGYFRDLQLEHQSRGPVCYGASLESWTVVAPSWKDAVRLVEGQRPSLYFELKGIKQIASAVIEDIVRIGENT
jgi:hypothetical protein